MSEAKSDKSKPEPTTPGEYELKRIAASALAPWETGDRAITVGANSNRGSVTRLTLLPTGVVRATIDGRFYFIREWATAEGA